MAQLIDLALDPVTHDLYLDDGDFAVVEDADALAQAIEIKLLMIRGDYYPDRSVGLPYDDAQDGGFLGKPVDPDETEDVLKAAIVTEPGVEELVVFDSAYDRDKRELSITNFEARTVLGLVTGSI